MNITNNQKASVHVVDVRTPEEFSAGHSEGAVNFPLNELMNHVDRLRSMDGTIVLCCASGMRSGSATAALRQIGFSNVLNAGPWYEVPNFIHNLN